jgi:GTP cyclohydrolase II
MKQKELYILSAPPGSNKSMYADVVGSFFNLYSISWGQIKIKSKPLDKYKLMKFELSEAYIKNDSVILNGFPQTPDEAEFILKFIKKYKIKLRAFIVLNISLDKIIDNLKNRILCLSCGLVYSTSHINDDFGICPGCKEKNRKIKVDIKEITNDYYNFVDSLDKIKNILYLFAESYFTISGDEKKHKILHSIIGKIESLDKNDKAIYERRADAYLPTRFGKFKVVVYQSKVDFSFVVVLVRGRVFKKKGVLTRVHSSCITGDLFASLKCDCGDQLSRSLETINEKKEGILIYLFQEGRGINIINKIKAYKLQDDGLDTVDANLALGLPAEMREYSSVRDILKDLGVMSVKLLTNNPEKISELEELGVVIESTVPLVIKPCSHNKKYLKTKKVRLHHKL